MLRDKAVSKNLYDTDQFTVRREYRTITRNEFKKKDQADIIRPVFDYLHQRFTELLGEHYRDAVSQMTRQPYNHVQKLLGPGGGGSATFYDVMRLAGAAGTSLDYLASLTGPNFYSLERVVDPQNFQQITAEEADLLAHLRAITNPVTRASVLEQLHHLMADAENATPPAPQTPRSRVKPQAPRTAVPSVPRTK